MRDIESVFEELYSANNEEEVIKSLKTIVRGYNTSLYSDRIVSNPYFMSLVKEVKIEILFEITEIRDSIKSELYTIDKELISSNKTETFLKLKELKRECIKLLHEVDDRITMLNRLF